MPLFSYKAVNRSGQISSGTHVAELVQQVEEWLIAQDLTPITIELAAARTGQPQPLTGNLAGLHARFKEHFTRVSLTELIVFCRQISTMLSAGIAVLQALQTIAGQIINPLLQKNIRAIASEIEGGASLSESFAKYPHNFSPLFLNVIRMGEESGSLDNSFAYLADLYENEKDIKERIKAATRYPKLVILAICSAVIFLMTFVVPKFIQIFARANLSLPLPTRILIAVSNFFSNNFLLILAGLVLLLLAYYQALGFPAFVRLRDSLLLKIPVIGDLTLKIHMSRFCRVFAVLTQSGVNVIKTLELSASALDNQVLNQMLRQILREVEGGVDLNTAFSRHPVFPAMMVEMLAIGEESGKVDTMMTKVAEFYDLETTYTIRQLSTLIEPFLLLFLGLMVGTIALSIFMPMWSMMDVLR